MRRLFENALFSDIPELYEHEFYQRLNVDNARKSYILARLSFLFVIVLVALDFVRNAKGELWNNPIHVGLMLTHWVLALQIIPYLMLRRHYNTISEGRYPRARQMSWLGLGLLALALLPMAILSIIDRGNITMYAIFILIANLVVNLSHEERITVNVLAFLVMMTAICLIQQNDVVGLFINMCESLGVVLPNFIFSTFQYNLTVREFVNEKKLEAQKQEIEREKQRSEALLHNILPIQIAEELKTNGFVRPRYFPQATVLFADFQGFSKICRMLTPEQLIADLNHCFRAFDHIVEQHGLERVKTIGDAYMCVGGVPELRADHAERMIRAAFAMHEFLQTWRAEKDEAGLPAFEARIGIHTGAVIAGVAGAAKFAFDIWGDAVNIAARMEESGQANRVNISGDTYELVKERFPCEFRGKIPIKNIGETEMYFVEKA